MERIAVNEVLQTAEDAAADHRKKFFEDLETAINNGIVRAFKH